MSLAIVAENGDNLQTLKALRQRLAEAIDNTQSGRDVAALSRQLQIVLEKIAELESLNEYDPVAAILNDQDITPASLRRARYANYTEDD